MPTPVPRANQAQTGAITIMVALMLLVLLTLAAIGMSRNSFREVVNSAFSRQGAMTSSLADSGLEWSIYWITEANSASASGDASNLVKLQQNLLANPNLAGVTYNIDTPNDFSKSYAAGKALTSGMTSPTTAAPTGVTEGYTIGLTAMGKIDITGMSSGAGPGAYSAAMGQSVMAPNLLGIRADAQVTQNKVTFTHGKEAWVATPIQ